NWEFLRRAQLPVRHACEDGSQHRVPAESCCAVVWYSCTFRGIKTGWRTSGYWSGHRIGDTGHCTDTVKRTGTPLARVVLIDGFSSSWWTHRRATNVEEGRDGIGGAMVLPLLAGMYHSMH